MSEESTSRAAEDSPAKGDGTAAPKSPKLPVLASEVLRDDVAPVKPWGTASRYWCVVLGVVFTALGFSPATKLGSHLIRGPEAHWGLGGLAILVALIPFKYGTRAAFMVALATATCLLGVSGLGPANALAPSTGEWGLLHFLTATGLPAALLFRARYRAYPGARYILMTALLVAFPFVVYTALLLAQGELAEQITAVITLLTMGLSLLGFMGSETRGGGEIMAVAVILAVTAELGTEAVLKSSAWDVNHVLWLLASVVAFTAPCTFASLGIFQLLAVRHWAQARDIDVKRDDSKRPPMPSLGDFWSTRR